MGTASAPSDVHPEVVRKCKLQAHASACNPSQPLYAAFACEREIKWLKPHVFAQKQLFLVHTKLAVLYAACNCSPADLPAAAGHVGEGGCPSAILQRPRSVGVYLCTYVT